MGNTITNPFRWVEKNFFGVPRKNSLFVSDQPSAVAQHFFQPPQETKTIVEYKSDPEIIQRMSQLEKNLTASQQENQNQMTQISELKIHQVRQQYEMQQHQQKLQQATELLEQKMREIEKMKKESIDSKIRYGMIEKELIETFKDQKMMDKIGFKKTELNIGVIGRVSTGKSLLVNAYFGLKVNRAKTGHEETTRVPSYYASEKQKNLKVWDFPGVGGTQFDYASDRKYIYLLAQMDMILVVFDGVFDVSARQTFNFVREMPNKKIFIYNKIDLLVDSIQYDRDFTTEEAIQYLRMEANIYANQLSAEAFFLVSARNSDINKGKPNHQKETYDWEELNKFLEK